MNPQVPDASLSVPLTDAEITELDELLLAIPEERDPLDVVMLDGFLTGVLLQPDVVLPSAWLPFVFDAQGREIELPGGEAEAQRMLGLLMRRHNEIAAHIAAREAFDPIVFELETADGRPLAGKAAIAALQPWAAGFMGALTAFPALLDAVETSEETAGALLGILRHLPPDPDDAGEPSRRFEREKAELDRDVPLADLDDAIDELVACVMDVAEFSRPRRPVVRDAPKAGRNDPCPCGSGRKFKHCHGRSVH
jgi:uncharacterized protein